MLAVSTGKTKVLLTTLAYTGLRRDEIVNVKPEDVTIKLDDIKSCFIIVRQGKGDKQRKIPLHTDLCVDLNEYLNTRDAPDFPYLFYSGKILD